MNRAALRTELQATGFNNTTSDVTRQNLWLDAAYLWVWHAKDEQGVDINWVFEKADQVALPVVANNASPVMPTDFGSADWLFDDQGNEINELEPEIFDRYYAADAALGVTAARAEAYKIRGTQIVLGPKPSVSANYLLSYTRTVAHFDVSLATVGGLFVADTDTPLWPNHHMILVYHAALVGHVMGSNPFSVSFQGLRDQALQAMRTDLETEFAPSQTWGDGGWGSTYGYGG